jgi:hypothetical protein
LIAEGGDALDPEAGSAPDVIVPAFYNFHHSAKMLSRSFVLFAAWYSETTLTAAEYPRLAAAGIVSLFGSTNVAMPFLLDFVRVPADTFQLFVATGVLNSRFGTLAGASHMIVLAIVGTYALQGRLRLSGPPHLVPVSVTDATNPFDAGLAVDAFVLTAERGSFLTLLHPAFSVAVPHPLDIRLPLAYPVAAPDLEAARFHGTWIEVKRKDGTIPALYDPPGSWDGTRRRRSRAGRSCATCWAGKG